MTSDVGSLCRVQGDTCKDIVDKTPPSSLLTPLSWLTFTGPDVSPALVCLLLQQLRLEAGQPDLIRRETLELSLLQGRERLETEQNNYCFMSGCFPPSSQ